MWEHHHQFFEQSSQPIFPRTNVKDLFQISFGAQSILHLNKLKEFAKGARFLHQKEGKNESEMAS